MKNGGGGGSRTRVRKHSTRASTCLSRILSVSLQGPSGPGPLKLILISVSRLSHQALTVAIPLVDALSRPAGVAWKDGSLCRYGVVIIVCDYIYFPVVLRADRKARHAANASLPPSNPFRPHFLKEHMLLSKPA